MRLWEREGGGGGPRLGLSLLPTPPSWKVRLREGEGGTRTWDLAPACKRARAPWEDLRAYSLRTPSPLGLRKTTTSSDRCLLIIALAGTKGGWVGVT